MSKKFHIFSMNEKYNQNNNDERYHAMMMIEWMEVRYVYALNEKRVQIYLILILFI